MASELVVIDSGVETDWYDPVTLDDISESADGWSFNNGFGDYFVAKAPGRTVVVRPLDGSAS